MSLAAGQKLDHYEIVEPIGKGGMGEVFRARDTKLGRDVAIKVLPEEFARDEERLARFKREAKVLASLNHPNIAHIYGLEESRGVSALVLELVEGPTLAERIAEGAIPLDEALAIAKQVAEALEAAHEQGIIHRDLKPANIKVTPEGVVKVLDFGLAKALASEPGGDASESPTVATAVTGMGMIMGTAAYMSPEQARGKTVDRRADIWAFGVVVYEMLTGRRAFDAEDVSLTLAEVMKSEPDWRALPSDVSPVVRLYLERCFRKDPKERIRDIGDVRLAMEGAFEIDEAAAVRDPGRRGHLVWPAIAAAIITGLAVWAMTRADVSDGPVSRSAIVLPQTQTRTNIGRRGIGISPDGHYVAYVANSQLYVRALDELEATPLDGTEDKGPTLPTFSPDGEWIAFYSTSERAIQKVARSGGAALTLCTTDNPFGMSWEDGIVFALGRSGVFRVSADGGEPDALVSLEDGERAQSPQLVDDGRTVVFTAGGNDWNEARIVIQSLETAERKVVMAGGTDARYLESGHLVYVRNGNLLAVPFDVKRREVSGGAVPLIEDVARAGITGGANFDVSRDGTLVYFPGRTASSRTLVWVDRSGREEPIPAEPNAYREARISPDGTKAVLTVGSANEDLWIWDFARETLTRLTSDESSDAFAEWSPDGRSVVWASRRDGPRTLYRRAADGTGAAERLFDNVSGTHNYPLSFTPDGTQLLVLERLREGSGTSLQLLTLGDEPSMTPLPVSEARPDNAQLSPDGRWMAYDSDLSGEREVYVRPFPDVDSGRWPISSGGGGLPLWGPSGDELFFWTADDALARVSIDTESGFRAGNAERVLERGVYSGDIFGRAFDIGPDGRRFLMLAERRSTADDDPFAGLTRIILVQNWYRELERLVPTH